MYKNEYIEKEVNEMYDYFMKRCNESGKEPVSMLVKMELHMKENEHLSFTQLLDERVIQDGKHWGMK